MIHQETPLKPQWEPVLWQAYSPGPIIGIDEVGRGCLAGPVCAGVAVLNPKHDISYLSDSKLLSPAKRSDYAKRLREEHQVALGWATAQEIDEVNIFQATFLAMRRALSELKQQVQANSGHVLVDGKFTIPELTGFRQTAFIKGDLRVAPISAASIVAKVARDEFMVEIAKTHYHYGFEKHKGYSTKVHKEAVKAHGPCEYHRRSFAGVKEYC